MRGNEESYVIVVDFAGPVCAAAEAALRRDLDLVRVTYASLTQRP